MRETNNEKRQQSRKEVKMERREKKKIRGRNWKLHVVDFWYEGFDSWTIYKGDKWVWIERRKKNNERERERRILSPSRIFIKRERLRERKEVVAFRHVVTILKISTLINEYEDYPSIYQFLFISFFYKINFLSALITTEISRGKFRDFSNRNPRDYEET